MTKKKRLMSRDWIALYDKEGKRIGVIKTAMRRGSCLRCRRVFMLNVLLSHVGKCFKPKKQPKQPKLPKPVSCVKCKITLSDVKFLERHIRSRTCAQIAAILEDTSPILPEPVQYEPEPEPPPRASCPRCRREMDVRYLPRHTRWACDRNIMAYPKGDVKVCCTRCRWPYPASYFGNHIRSRNGCWA